MTFGPYYVSWHCYDSGGAYVQRGGMMPYVPRAWGAEAWRGQQRTAAGSQSGHELDQSRAACQR